MLFLGWEAGADAFVSRAEETFHEFMTFFIKFPSSLSFLSSGSDDAGWAVVRGFLAAPEYPRNLTDARNRSGG